MSDGQDLRGDIVRLDESDQVAVALRRIEPGRYDGPAGPCVVSEPIEPGFKLALRPIVRGEIVRKYGYPIGAATADIAAGECVHVHNLASGV